MHANNTVSRVVMILNIIAWEKRAHAADFLFYTLLFLPSFSFFFLSCTLLLSFSAFSSTLYYLYSQSRIELEPVSYASGNAVCIIYYI